MEGLNNVAFGQARGKGIEFETVFVGDIEEKASGGFPAPEPDFNEPSLQRPEIYAKRRKGPAAG